MSEAYFTVANRSGSASSEEIANRRKAIHNFIQARITDAATVDDLTQEVLVKAQRAGSSLKDSAKLEGWMFRIARNMIADHFRNAKKFVIFSSNDDAAIRPDIALFTQEQESRKAHLLRCIHAFAESLPDHYRTALELVDFRRHFSSRTGEALRFNDFSGKIQSSACPSQVARFDRCLL
jgi:RNA polymerase sigma factor (sigma-70 family)